MPNLNRA